jgi:hypothetical protein
MERDPGGGVGGIGGHGFSGQGACARAVCKGTTTNNNNGFTDTGPGARDDYFYREEMVDDKGMKMGLGPVYRRYMKENE